MRDPFEQGSERPRDQLLATEPHSPASKEGPVGPSADDQMFDVDLEFQREVEGRIHFLRKSGRQALLMDSQWTPAGEQHEFSNEGPLKSIAERNGLVLHKTSREEAGGTSHLLFLGKDNSVTEEEYLGSVPPTVPKGF